MGAAFGAVMTCDYGAAVSVHRMARNDLAMSQPIFAEAIAEKYGAPV
jgi:hypothetical protein